MTEKKDGANSVRSNDRLAPLVDNAIKIAKIHKEKCDDEDCDYSMFLLGKLCIAAGAELTHEQWAIFM